MTARRTLPLRHRFRVRRSFFRPLRNDGPPAKARCLLALALPALLLLASGCASSPEIQASSADLGRAIEELRESQDAIRMSWIEQIEDTRWQIVEAVLAAQVNARIEGLSTTAADSSLIAIAGALREERKRTRENLAELVAIQAQPGDEPAALLDARADEEVENLLAFAEHLPPTVAEDVRRQARERTSPFHLLLRDHRADLETLVRLSAMQAQVAAGFEDLDLYLQFLASLQRQIDLWLTTAAEVDGGDLARLVDENAALWDRRSTAQTGGTP